MDDEYTFWHALLAGGEIGKDVHNDGNEPQCGFWRTKELEPVAIWLEEGETVMCVGERMIPPEKQPDIWTRVMNRPVTEEAYRAVMDGFMWNDVDGAVADFSKAIRDAGTEQTLAFLIDSMKSRVSQYDNIETEDASAAAQSLRSALLEAKRKADGLREEQKAPHLKACRDVDATWQPMIREAEQAANTARNYIAKWEAVKRQAAIDADRRAKEAREAEERQGMPHPKENSEGSDTLSNMPAPQATVKGGYGRAASVRTRNVVTGIDPRKVFEHYWNSNEVIALLTKLAQADVDKGLTVDGATVENQVVIR